MKDLIKTKFVTGITVLATLILAGVAVFTAIRLYQLKGEPVAPNVPVSEPKAYSCEEYKILLNTNGIVRIINSSTETQPSRTIDLIVNGTSLGNFTIPALDPESDAILGGINLPTGDFNWSITGDIFCQGDSSGTQHETSLCQTFSFSVNAQTISPTPTISAIPTQSATSTPAPTGQITQAPTPTPFPTSTAAVSASVTPVQPPLPDTGVSLYTLFGIGLGLFIIVGSILLAL